MIVIVNFKTYPHSIGEEAVKLAKTCEKIAVETKTDVRVAVSSPDIYRVSQAVKIPVLSEHVDPHPPDRHTGSIVVEDIKSAGASGSLINHSEHKVKLEIISETIKRCKEQGLTTVVCAANTQEGVDISFLKPDIIAVEPPELIAGDVSVSNAKPELISESVKRIKEEKGIPLLVGAGVKSHADLQKALELGSDGVLLASGITKSDDPEASLRSLILG